MPSELFPPLPLRSGPILTVSRRAAMEEGRTEQSQLPGSRLSSPYRRWG
jgi:hypothetical protein